MNRLTEKDEQGNWCVKGLPWKNLYVGALISEETWEKLYGALRKLLDYEETGLSPEGMERRNSFHDSQKAAAAFQEETGAMRVYISGPITGHKNYRQEFGRAEAQLREGGYEVVNPAAFSTQLPALTYEEYLEIDLTLLAMCDAIYMLPGWQESRGANREHGYALAKGIKIMEE